MSNPSDVLTLVSTLFSESAAEVDPVFVWFKLSGDKTLKEMKHLQALNSELNEGTACGEKDITNKFINNVSQIFKIPINIYNLTLLHRM